MPSTVPAVADVAFVCVSVDREPVSKRYIGPKIETRIPQIEIEAFDKAAFDNEMSRAEYVREVLHDHYLQILGDYP